jgi:hypothetical protein
LPTPKARIRTEIRIPAIRIRAMGTRIRATRIRGTRTRVTEIRLMATRAMGIRIRPTRIRAIRIRAMGTRLTSIPGRLPRALMATTPIILTRAHPMATTGLAGFRADSLSALGLGVGDAATTGVVATTADEDSMVAAATAGVAGRPFPGAEDFAAGSATVTAAAHVPTVAAAVRLVEPDEASVAAVVRLVEPDAASVAAVVRLVEPDAASVAAVVRLVEADVASVAAVVRLVEADTVEAEAVMVGGAGRLRH